MNYLTFKRIKYGYQKLDTNNEYLNTLAEIFDDGNGWIVSVKRQLLDPNNTGITGNIAEVDIHDNKVAVGLQHTDNFEENAIIVDRNVLLDLINQWQDFAAKNAQEITFILHDDGTITMNATF